MSPSLGRRAEMYGQKGMSVHMKGDYLYKQEMLRKGIRNCIIWMIFILLFSGAIYALSFFLLTDDHMDHFSNKRQDIKRTLSVELFSCPVDVEVEVLGKGNATILLIPASEDGKENPDIIALANNTRYFHFRGTLESGEYYVIVEHISGDSYDVKSKVHFKSFDVYIMKPILIYVFIGAGVIELLLVVWLVTVIIRRRNLTKEMILASSKGSGDSGYYDELYGDRDGSKHSQYQDLFPKEEGLTDFEKSRSKDYSNDAKSLYEQDYAIRKKSTRSRSGSGPSRSGDFEESRDFMGGTAENTRSGRRGRNTVSSRRDGPMGSSRGTRRDRETSKDSRRSPRRESNRKARSGPRTRGPIRRGNGNDGYDIEYIPPGATDRQLAGSRSGSGPISGAGASKRHYRRRESDIDWGGGDDQDDGKGFVDYDDHY